MAASTEPVAVMAFLAVDVAVVASFCMLFHALLLLLQHEHDMEEETSSGSPKRRRLDQLDLQHASSLATTQHTNSKDDVSEEERVRRRREINRNSQKRIRERRNKEMDDLRAEVRAGRGGWRKQGV